MRCYRNGGCGPYEMYSCSECPASKPEYATKNTMARDYKVITLCGSTKFKDEFMKAQKELTLKGYIVISVGLFGHSGDDEAWDDGVKEMLDDMHKRKIDMADEIMVIDVDGYIGKSTESEIEYAKSKGKFIYFYNHPGAYYDDVGGFHDSGIGWNPNDVWCGECTKLTCRDCSSRDSEGHNL